MHRLKVRDLMSTELITLDEDEDLDLADEIMRLGRIRHLPVVRGSELVGLVTHRDLLRAQVSVFADLSPDETHELNRRIRVREIMNRQVRTIDPDATALEAARLMRTNHFGCLPVVEKGRLVGILTEADFVQLVIDALVNEEARAQKEASP